MSHQRSHRGHHHAVVPFRQQEVGALAADLALASGRFRIVLPDTTHIDAALQALVVEGVEQVGQGIAHDNLRDRPSQGDRVGGQAVVGDAGEDGVEKIADGPSVFVIAFEDGELAHGSHVDPLWDCGSFEGFSASGVSKAVELAMY